MPSPPRLLGLSSATLVVVASMIGVGVFTTTGFLVRDVGSAPAVLLAWALGGAIALAGALCYAELGAAYPRNGGEYALLSEIYHPAVGFLAGWVSLVVGFSAPAAAAAIGFGDYLAAAVPGVPPRVAAVGVVLLTAALHAARVRLGAAFHDAATALQVALVLVLVGGGLAAGDPSRLALGETDLGRAALSPAFAVGLIYVTFAYSGWNAAAYVAGEIRDPGRTLPRALLLGTGLVTLLYVALNAVILMAAPADSLSGVPEVAHVAATHLFGDPAGRVLSGVIALGLAASASALAMTGPRVYEAMGQDHPGLRFLVRGGEGGPTTAIALQTGLALVLALTAAFDALLTWIGFTLAIFTALTAAGVFVSRRRRPDLPRPYRTFGYPVTPALFVVAVGWIVAHALYERPAAALAGFATLAAGVVLYLGLTSRRDRGTGGPASDPPPPPRA